MSELLQWVGMVALLLVALGVALAGCAFLYSRIEEWQAVRRYRVEELARRRYANALLAASWWFGESPGTALAIRLIAEDTAQTGNERLDTDSIRNKWRAALDDEAAT